MIRKKHIKSKRKLKRNHLFAILVFCMIAFIVLSNHSETAKANYTESIILDSCKTESSYELIKEEVDYSVWYANSQQRHFLFLNFTYNLTTKPISIYTSDFNYNLSSELIETSFLKSKHINNTLEIEIERSLIGNEFTISVDGDTIDLEVAPKNAPPPLYIPPEEEEEESKVIRVDPITDLKNGYKKNLLLFFLHIVLGCAIFFGGIFGVLYMKNRYTEYPVHYVENDVSEKEWKELLPKEPKKKKQKKLRKLQKREERTDLAETGIDKRFLQQEGFNIKEDFIKLGRMIKEIGKSKITGKNVLLYKSGRNFLLEIHCDDHLDQVKGSKQKKFYMFYTLLRKYTLRTLNIPEDKQNYKYIRKRGLKNGLIFFIARRFPKGVGLSLKDKILESVYEKTNELNKKVLYLQHEDQRDRLKIVADLIYERKVPDSSDPNKWSVEIEKEAPLFLRALYKNDPDIRTHKEEDIIVTKDGDKIETKGQKVIVRNIKEKITPIDPLYRAKYKESEDNLRSQAYFIQAELQERIDKKNDHINKLEMERAKDHAELERKYGKMIANFQKAKITPIDKFAEVLMADYMKKGDAGKAIQKAYEKLEKDDVLQEYNKKLRELNDPHLVEKQQQKIEILEKQLETMFKGNGNTKKKSILDEIGQIEEGEE